MASSCRWVDHFFSSHHASFNQLLPIFLLSHILWQDPFISQYTLFFYIYKTIHPIFFRNPNQQKCSSPTLPPSCPSRRSPSPPPPPCSPVLPRRRPRPRPPTQAAPFPTARAVLRARARGRMSARMLLAPRDVVCRPIPRAVSLPNLASPSERGLLGSVVSELILS